MKTLEKIFAEKLLKIKAIKLQPNSPFTWASGWKSPFYCDNRKTLSYPELRSFVKTESARIIMEEFPGVDAVAGVATGAIPQGALVADLLSVAGIDRLITMDLHADQIQGFFDVPVDHLYASGVLLPYVQSLHLKDLVIASPDVGGSKRANTYAKYLGCPLVLCNKTRARANVVASMQIIGDVKDKNVVIIDDMVDTAGTITKAANIMKEAGALSVRAIASHCVMSGPASERVQESELDEIVFTDSIPYTNRCSKVKQLSVAEMFAETIQRVVNNLSISSQYLV